jgi:DNA-binding transcriptional MerR regulator
MPEPIKKRYYRVHIAYLLIICTLKQGLSIALIQKILPIGLSDEELHQRYDVYARRHRLAAVFFIEQIRHLAGPILDHADADRYSSDTTEELIVSSVVLGGLSRLLAEKLLLLEGKDLSDGGSITIDGSPSA